MSDEQGSPSYMPTKFNIPSAFKWKRINKDAARFFIMAEARIYLFILFKIRL